MQHEELRRGTTLQYVGRFMFFIKPNGELIVAMGNRRLNVTPDEAKGLFDFLLLYARHFEEASRNGQAAS